MSMKPAVQCQLSAHTPQLRGQNLSGRQQSDNAQMIICTVSVADLGGILGVP